MQEFKQFNLDNHIPIMRDKTINHLYHLFDRYNNANILEIGTGFGYSALFLAKHKNIKKIISLEKDTKRFNVAKKWLNNNKKICLINISAFDYVPKQFFDCLIMDGPKRKQTLLFNKFSNFINRNGFIFIDNLNLFQNINKPMTKNRLKLKKEVELFKSFIKNLSSWNIKIFNIDDGFGIVRRI